MLLVVSGLVGTVMSYSCGMLGCMNIGCIFKLWHTNGLVLIDVNMLEWYMSQKRLSIDVFLSVAVSVTLCAGILRAVLFWL